MSAQRRFEEIDLLRFLAAFVVLVFHFAHRGYVAGKQEFQYPALESFARHGHLGVDLFFVISGFVIAMSAAGRSPYQFIKSRCVRLYPAYWTGVLLTSAAIVFWGRELMSIDLTQVLVNLTMLQKFVDVPHIDGVYWSLVVELKFYFLVFVVLLFNQYHRLPVLLYVFFGLTVIDQLFKIPVLSFFLFSRWSAYFIAGCCFYCLSVNNQARWPKVLIVLCLIDLIWYRFNINPGVNFDPVVFPLFIVALFALFWSIAYGWLSWIRGGWLVFAGSLTYPLYLIHQNLGYVLFSKLPQTMDPWLALLIVSAVCFAITIFIASVIEPTGGGALKRLFDRFAGSMPDFLNRTTTRPTLVARESSRPG